MNIKVIIQEDNIGNIAVRPVREDIRRIITEHLQDFGVESDGRAFFNEGGEAQQFQQQLSNHCIRELKRGFNITMNIDAWTAGHWYGWDTHTLFE